MSLDINNVSQRRPIALISLEVFSWGWVCYSW